MNFLKGKDHERILSYYSNYIHLNEHLKLINFVIHDDMKLKFIVQQYFL